MNFEVYLSQEKIANRVEALGQDISSHYADKLQDGEKLLVLGVLNGAFLFCADLIRHINLPLEVDFIRASSYRGTESSGEVQLQMQKEVESKITGRHVLIVEDIVDTGLTLTKIISSFNSLNPSSLKLCSLLYKPARNTHPVTIDYLGFEIEDRFVIGYGLDYNQEYRNLPYIGIYSE